MPVFNNNPQNFVDQNEQFATLDEKTGLTYEQFKTLVENTNYLYQRVQEMNNYATEAWVENEIEDAITTALNTPV